ncbi:FAD-dependent oxidoreductase [Actinophytocola sp.]|uniref:NAD(P)/FAD-dependent oxidoreductase n=1 Tax=Actinophytocola sp. TaxID=1872138 RepID=UPI002D802CA3|nr:FAD-dependent oxidoreductase [Actinophytocola sp.]HET9138516.1 FAD-dependent oxidoreductase [Actinophytocola sp.]
MDRDYRTVSWWLADSGAELTPRPSVPGDVEVDIAIVGAGYTGLWTAYYLAGADPGLRIAVLEAEIAGYGASGRNGGWCSALFPAAPHRLATRFGQAPVVALHRALRHAVDEVGRVAAAERIDCHYVKSGTLMVARDRVQLRRAHAAVAEAREFGLGPDDLTLLPASEARSRCAASGVLGATYTPHCATIHPARLVHGLAQAVQRRGVRIYERSPVTAIHPGRAECPQGTVRAEVVVLATEAFGAALPGRRRSLAPLYSQMILTAPLPEAFWRAAGLAGRETFSDYRRLVVYGQRTADDRLAFGGRGTYHLGSGIRPDYDRRPRLTAKLTAILTGLFPALDGVEITHSWGGAVAAARDLVASVGLDRARGLAWAGGYLGDGVSLSNLAGRTLADLITGAGTELTTLPWVGHRSPAWEPEPLRWLGITSRLRLVQFADWLGV